MYLILLTERVDEKKSTIPGSGYLNAENRDLQNH